MLCSQCAVDGIVLVGTESAAVANSHPPIFCRAGNLFAFAFDFVFVPH